MPPPPGEARLMPPPPGEPRLMPPPPGSILRVGMAGMGDRADSWSTSLILGQRTSTGNFVSPANLAKVNSFCSVSIFGTYLNNSFC